MGKYVVSKAHFEAIIKDYSKNEHFLSSSYLDGKLINSFNYSNVFNMPVFFRYRQNEFQCN